MLSRLIMGLQRRKIAERLLVLALLLCIPVANINAEPSGKKKPSGKPNPQAKRKPSGDTGSSSVISKLEAQNLKGFDPTTPIGRFRFPISSKTDVELQKTLEAFDFEFRGKYDMEAKQTAVGLLDLRTLRVAMVNPDRGEYAASVAKIGILLAYFQLHPEAATNLDPKTHLDLGKMVKASSNEMAAMFSAQMGLTNIQQVLDAYRLYDAKHGGGLWVGKHYGKGTERYGDPVGDHSHAATVRQVLRFYLLLEQGRLVSPDASRVMREIFATPQIAHDNIKFVKALAGREVEIIRKWGTFQTYMHDSAVIKGRNRHYILVALTNHPQGDKYLEDMALRVDDLMIASAPQ